MATGRIAGPGVTDYPVDGVYLEVVEPERLVMTVDCADTSEDQGTRRAAAWALANLEVCAEAPRATHHGISSSG